MNSRPESRSLAALQASFAEAIRAGGPGSEASISEFAAHVVDDGIPPASRVQVYRNNALAMFEGALERTFPVLERRVGKPYFRQLAMDFRAEHPSRSGDLHWVGEAFPRWLRARIAGAEYAWLADLAQLEWSCEEALVAAQLPPLEPAALARVGAERLADVTFTLQPNLRLVTSAFPVWSVWQANQPDAPGDPIDPALGAQHVVVACSDAGLALHSIPADQFAFVSALAGGATLGEALEYSRLDVEGLPDLLAWLFCDGLVVAIREPIGGDAA